MRAPHFFAVVLASALFAASQARAVEIIFTGKITSGVDHGALFSPVNTNLTGQLITVEFSGPPVAPGETEDDAFIGSVVTIDGQSFFSGDNDYPTAISISPGSPSMAYGGTTQTFDLGYSDTFATVSSGHAFVPADADLNSAFSYRTRAGDQTTGQFDVGNAAFPGEGYDGPPFGGPGSSTPWSEIITFSVADVYVNTPVGAPVPEPAMWLLMMVGLGGLGGAMRIRRRRYALN